MLNFSFKKNLSNKWGTFALRSTCVSKRDIHCIEYSLLLLNFILNSVCFKNEYIRVYVPWWSYWSCVGSSSSSTSWFCLYVLQPNSVPLLCSAQLVSLLHYFPANIFYLIFLCIFISIWDNIRCGNVHIYTQDCSPVDW